MFTIFSGRKQKLPQKQEEFFDEFAKSNKFDPLIATNWYSVTHSDIMGAGVCSHQGIYSPEPMVMLF
jgi:hypothetical protein